MAHEPVDTIRDGAIKASIWKNESEKGPYFATTISRSYKNADGDWKESRSFNSSDLLKVAEVARLAYARTNDLRRDLQRDQAPDRDHGGREDRRDLFNERRNGSGQSERRAERGR